MEENQENQEKQDKLFYYSKSKDVYPGQGVNENVNHPEEFKKLSQIPNWRLVLSNFYVSPFEYEGYTWNSVEHAFQSKKIGLVDPQKAFWFTLDSGHKIGQGNGLEARKNRKLILLNDQELKKWFHIRSKIMEDILYSKFSQVPLAAKVLYATNDAELWHSPGREKAERQLELENVRDRLIMDTDLNLLKKLLLTR
jgi:predicted NAD-dependent protein-ADP-ribosyltransferase YbiA (DUF1768 family)